MIEISAFVTLQASSIESAVNSARRLAFDREIALALGLEHLRQHERTTLADKALQDAVNAFHTLPESPRVLHAAAPARERH